MELSMLIAKLYAVVAILLGLGILLNAKYYRKLFLEMLKNKGALFSSGVFSAVIGVLMITYHNIWVESWVVAITILGWAALVKGITLILFPETFNFMKKYYKSAKYWNFQAVMLVIAGGILGYLGWFA